MLRFVGLLGIFAWLFLYTAAMLAALLGLFVNGNEGLCDLMRVDPCNKGGVNFAAVGHSMVGGVLGTGVLGMVSFHRYVSEDQTFDFAHGWGFFIAPLLGAVLGLVVYALLQAGMLLVTGEAQLTAGTGASNLTYFAIGFLSGFAWRRAVERVNEIAKRFFSDSRPRTAANTGPITAAAVAAVDPAADPQADPAAGAVDTSQTDPEPGR